MICDRCGHDVLPGEWPFCDHQSIQRGTHKTDIFPYTINHVDGKPMTIESLAHARRVEKQYGVVFSAFNKDNVHDLDPIANLPRYRGDDPDVKRR